jgi:hypothetical protein
MAALAAVTQSMVAAALAVSPPVSGATANYLQSLVETAHARHLDETRDWQVLLHYRRTLFGGQRSEADGAGFFLAGPQGRRDPAAELDASLRAFLADTPVGDEHAQCRFPARWDWLKRTLGVDAARAPDRRCPNFETWRTGISAEAVTLVYATAFLNNPASMYGHTFLRLSRSTGEGNRLLDYAVNFAADVDTENGLLYAMKGVAGLFPGRFYVMPYYVKVQEYSNMESRDLWEYELTLSAAQVSRLVMHAWETRATHFNYYFFSRNCSYQLLALLEAADPNLHLIEQLGPSVIPSDTVRVVLKQPGLVRLMRPRPSLMTIMLRRKAVLNAVEVRRAETWATAPPDLPAPAPDPTTPKEREARILDAAYDYLRFREGLKAEPSDAFKHRERRLLLARGALGVPPQEVITTPTVDAPQRGHATLRLSLGTGTADQGGPFQTLGVRGAIHDYLDPPRGYPADARLQMGDLRLRFDDETRRLSLDRLDLVDIVSAAPLDRWTRGLSWKVWVGVDNARELGCARPESPHHGWRCLYTGAVTGGGIAVRFGPRDAFLMMLLAETELSAGPAFSDSGGYRIGGGGEAFLTGGAGDRWRFELGGRYAYYVLGDRQPNLRARMGQSLMLTRRFAFRLSVDTAGTYAQGLVEIVAYL